MDTPAVDPAAPYSINLIASGSADTATFREQLAQAGHRVSEVDAVAFAAVADTEDIEADKENEIAVILVEESGEAVEQATQLIALVARVAAAAAERDIPLWLITSGAQQSADGGNAGVVGAALWGFGRVLVNEMPRLKLRLIDLAPGMGWAERADRFASELAAATPETEIVWTS